MIVTPPRADEEELNNLIKELSFLAKSAGVEVSFVVTLKKRKTNPAYFIGIGKAEEIGNLAAEKEAGLVIFNDDLFPAQQRNLEDLTKVRVIDHTQLILDIFAARAKSREGKLQVELARLSYLLPRLKGRGVELSQLGGGIATRGPGETQLEESRREIRRRLVKLKKDIEKIRQHRALQRKQRKIHPAPLVVLVGYTNSGKSTLLNSLSGSELEVENKLFVTLDPTTRKVKFPTRREVLFTDTVGFIRSLPHHLVEAFKGTLEEVNEADVLLIVLEGSHPQHWEHLRVVKQVLKELGAEDKPTLVALNKIDLVSRAERKLLEQEFPQAVAISALWKQGLTQLMEKLEASFPRQKTTLKLLIPQKAGKTLAMLRKDGNILKEKYSPEGVCLEVELDEALAGNLEQYQQKVKG